MNNIWQQSASIERLTDWNKDTAAHHLGIEFIEIGNNFIRGRLHVDQKTTQPMGVLHGGVSVVLAETLGSCGAALAMPENTQLVGLDINANHIRGVTKGWVEGKATPLHLGRRTHVWGIDITDEQGRLVCISRLTVAILS